MNERVLRFRVGVVALVAVLITGILIFFFAGGSTLMHGGYTLYFRFPAAPGVAKDTPVRKNGVLIGRVTRVDLQEEGGVKITARIDRRYTLYSNEVPRIGTSSLLGDAVLEFVPAGKPGDPRETLQDGDFLSNGVVSGDPMQVLVHLEDDLRGATRSITGAGDEVSQAARNLNALLDDNEQQVRRVMQKSEVALDRFIRAMDDLNDVVGDEETKQQLKQAVADLPKTFQEIRQTFADTRQTLAGIDRVSKRAEANLNHIERFTKPLGDKGERLVEDIGLSVTNLNEMLSQMAQFSAALNDRQGTLGKLVYDRELYDRLRRASNNIENASRRLGPIMEDVRIFTDKIARDPRQLGVKGALDRRPSGAGYKSPSFPWRRDSSR